MKRNVLLIVAVALIAGGAVSIASSGNDCPGVMTCPLTGQVICVERCPITHPDAEPCPGTKVCPTTGQTICVERCSAD